MTGCKKDSLDLVNPNEPGIPALQTEEGMKRAALGLYSKFGLEYFWLGLGYHNSMGDAIFISAGNFSWRWANQVAKISTNDGTVYTPPQGADQPTELRNRNTRAFGNDNVFFNEWSSLYLVNNQANLILEFADDPELVLTGNAATKKATLKAWGYWWKGFVYSRIGSIYIAGIKADKFNSTNGDFLTSAQMIEEAGKNFDLAAQELDKATDNASYEDMMTALIPSFTKFGHGLPPSQAMWKRHMNTYKARNLLVNKKLTAMTPADWATILTLTQDGLQKDDMYFTMRSALVNDIVSEIAWAPWRLLSFGWEFLSERLVQDFKPGDARFTRNVTTTAPSYPVVNRSSRGYQFGTRYALKDIANGGDWASSTAGLAEIPVGCSYEENALMRAEALIKTTQIEAGLALIDAVRTYQNAQLPAVAGTGLNEAAAYEELRRERRIGLFLKNVVFYDARRWNVSTKGGGRTNAIVLAQGAVPKPATFNYDYLDYWDVPNNELDFNAPNTGSAPVVSPN